ncbi:NAD binding domain of 6-phosphogluconate dehydrogenase family protein [Mycobacteroides abscessus subsp. bolletii 1513]|uniref:NAD binding domain of 6-phosphogluconate dehydrogenase family protein n=1 Tax=Mycobacteroides abscessus subsp. bolletii 1513 TaxID=1299321 RepID=X8DWL0_9MYCO|nr:NAD binding domain of 6-phosphogluconate dehydrogenase family protein [Mycobacteroides abscessus subsp. bolletii 1513]
MTQPALKLGYIGLGNMGAPMARRLVDWPGGLTVFDLRAEAMAPLVEEGAVGASDVADIADADLISVTVLDDAQVRQVVGQIAPKAKPAPSSRFIPPSAIRRPSSWHRHGGRAIFTSSTHR